MKKILYLFINGAFHLLHIAVIIFVIVGWIFTPLRLFHLIFILLMLASWFLLGHWLGAGYCPLTDWHWKIKSVFNQHQPSTPYISFLLQSIFKNKLSTVTVNKAVLISTMSLLLISLIANVV